MPNVKSFRCILHTAQRSLERTLESDPRTAELVKKLVTQFSGSDNENPGGLARALKNSGVHLAKFQEAVRTDLQTVAALADSMPSFSQAYQRFDTVGAVLGKIAIYISPVIQFLSRLVAEKSKYSKWASEILKAGRWAHSCSTICRALRRSSASRISSCWRSSRSSQTSFVPSYMSTTLVHTSRMATCRTTSAPSLRAPDLLTSFKRPEGSSAN